MNRFQQRAAHVPRALTWLIASPMLALGAYWWWSYSGLYRLLAEWQLHTFHSHYPKYTGVVELLLCMIPVVIAIQIIGGLREKERSPADAAAQAESYAARSARTSNWLQSHRRRLIGLVVTAMAAVAGVYFTALGLLAGDRVSVDAGAIEKGERPGGRYVELTGRPLVDDAVSVSEEGRSSSAKIYIPVVSAEWQPGQPVRFYLETRRSLLESQREEVASGRYEGMLSANDLPGVAITALAEDGHPAPEQYWVLDYQETPRMKADLGYAMLAAAAIAGFITAIAWVVARREREAARPAA
jgi:hypothetical protein